jgi:hypothetical protein
MGDLERTSKDQDLERVSMEEIEAEGATALPNKEVMSLLDVNANVDLGLDLAAPVDLAAAANLNVAAPIEAAASANVLSDGAQAVGIASQHGTIDQGITGTADATADQQADIAQNANPEVGATDGAAAPADASAAIPEAGATAGAVPDAGGAVDGVAGAVPDTGGAVDGVAGAVPDAGGAVPDAGGAVDGVAGAVPDTSGAVQGVTGGVDSLLSGGNLLDANVDIHANADLTAPVDGAVAANANVAAPINASVAANIDSDGAVAQSLADQGVDIHQSLDGVEANADATQDASVDQQ